MSRRNWLVLPLMVVAMGGNARSEEPAAAEKDAPDVAGAWTGTWGPFDPAKGSAVDEEQCKSLDCAVVKTDTGWQATFEGECGRPYKYTIVMNGRQAGDVVLFRGTVDLGEKDGGTFDWIGRATDKEFVGFYTSPRYTGVFRMARGKSTGDAKADAEAEVKPFLGVPDDVARRIGDDYPATALGDVPKVSAVQDCDYAAYASHKKAGRIVAEEARGEFVYFAVESILHVPLADGTGAYVNVTERYKAKVPQTPANP